jgi:hypothetical protein
MTILSAIDPGTPICQIASGICAGKAGHGGEHRRRSGRPQQRRAICAARSSARHEAVPGTVYFLSAEGRGGGEVARAEKSKLSPAPTRVRLGPAAAVSATLRYRSLPIIHARPDITERLK